LHCYPRSCIMLCFVSDGWELYVRMSKTWIFCTQREGVLILYLHYILFVCLFFVFIFPPVTSDNYSFINWGLWFIYDSRETWGFVTSRKWNSQMRISSLLEMQRTDQLEKNVLRAVSGMFMISVAIKLITHQKADMWWKKTRKARVFVSTNKNEDGLHGCQNKHRQ
jgi:hypothetical protein